MVGGEIDGWMQAAVGLLCCVVDDATAGGDAAFEAGDAFDDFDTLLVFERDILFAGDGQAVDLEAGGEIDGESADLEIAVVANGGVVFADGGVVFDDVRERAGDLVANDGAGDVGDGDREFLRWRCHRGWRLCGGRKRSRL